MSKRRFRLPESHEAERVTRQMVPPFLETRGFRVESNTPERQGQTIVAVNPAGERLTLRVRLCWRRESGARDSERVRTYSAAQLLASITNDDWIGSLQEKVERERSHGVSHLLVVQRDDNDMRYAALIPLTEVVAIWSAQRDTSQRLLNKHRLGRRTANHAMNGSSPMLYLQDDRGGQEVADALWNHPGVENLVEWPRQEPGASEFRNRQIWIYGNPDKSDRGFPMPGDLTQYIKSDIFDKEHGRYRYTQGKYADVIVLSREGLVYGHFDVDSKVTPNDDDRIAYPDVRFVYLVHKSTLYDNPVPLSSLGVSKLRFGRKITEDQFRRLQLLAGGTEAFEDPRLPQNTVAELERVLREVKRRLGQSDFRRELVASYGGRCAVTGCNAVQALEAAHIAPYDGSESNAPSNGLLLRADIHTLFDANLLGIEPKELTIELHPLVQETCYSDLRGKRLASPINPIARPDPHALAKRWRQFAPP